MLMRIALKLLNCRVNITYFVKNHDALFIKTIFMKTKNRHCGSIMLIVFVKLVTRTLPNIL